eukprot:5463101-Prymnesium_polylepis.1
MPRKPAPRYLAASQVEACLARDMFDSGTEIGPVNGEGSLLDEGGVEVLPKDLFLVLRVTQVAWSNPLTGWVE